MKRRQFIAGLGSAAATLLRTAQAQQLGRIPRVGVLMGWIENEPEFRSWLAAFVTSWPDWAGLTAETCGSMCVGQITITIAHGFLHRSSGRHTPPVHCRMMTPRPLRRPSASASWQAPRRHPLPRRRAGNAPPIARQLVLPHRPGPIRPSLGCAPLAATSSCLSVAISAAAAAAAVRSTIIASISRGRADQLGDGAGRRHPCDAKTFRSGR
jgi:hypothetical protein